MSRPRSQNGRPSITRGADGMFHCWVSLGSDPLTGKRLRRHIRGTTRAEVMKAVREAERALESGVVVTRGSVDEWGAQWLTAVATDRKAVTVRGYESHWRCYIGPRLGSIPLVKLTTDDIEAMLRWMVSADGPGVKAVTAGSVRRTLRACLGEAVKRGRLIRNPATYARVPRGELTRVGTIAREHARRITGALDGHPQRARFLLGLTTGIRQGEALGLRRCDLDLDEGTMVICGSLTRGTWRHGCIDAVACAAPHCRTEMCLQPCPRHQRACPPVCPPGCTGHARCCPLRFGGGLFRETTKTGRTRVIALPAQMTAVLREHLRTTRKTFLAVGTPWNDDGYVFCYPEDGRPINPRTDWGTWTALLEKAGVPHYRIHGQRHYAATEMQAAGTDPATIMAVMGWSSIAMLAVYADVVDESKRAAAAVLGRAVFD